MKGKGRKLERSPPVASSSTMRRKSRKSTKEKLDQLSLPSDVIQAIKRIDEKRINSKQEIAQLTNMLMRASTLESMNAQRIEVLQQQTIQMREMRMNSNNKTNHGYLDDVVSITDLYQEARSKVAYSSIIVGHDEGKPGRTLLQVRPMSSNGNVISESERTSEVGGDGAVEGSGGQLKGWLWTNELISTSQNEDTVEAIDPDQISKLSLPRISSAKGSEPVLFWGNQLSQEDASEVSRSLTVDWNQYADIYGDWLQEEEGDNDDDDDDDDREANGNNGNGENAADEGKRSEGGRRIRLPKLSLLPAVPEQRDAEDTIQNDLQLPDIDPTSRSNSRGSKLNSSRQSSSRKLSRRGTRSRGKSFGILIETDVTETSATTALSSDNNSRWMESLPVQDLTTIDSELLQPQTQDLQRHCKDQYQHQENDLSSLLTLSRMLNMQSEGRNYRGIERNYAILALEESLDPPNPQMSPVARPPAYMNSSSDPIDTNSPPVHDPFLHIHPYGHGLRRQFSSRPSTTSTVEAAFLDIKSPLKQSIIKEEEGVEDNVFHGGSFFESGAISSETQTNAVAEEGGKSFVPSTMAVDEQRDGSSGLLRAKVENEDHNDMMSVKWKEMQELLQAAEDLALSRSASFHRLELDEHIEPEIDPRSTEEYQAMQRLQKPQPVVIDHVAEDTSLQEILTSIRGLQDHLQHLRRNRYSIELSQLFAMSETQLLTLLPLLTTANAMTDTRQPTDEVAMRRLRADCATATQALHFGQNSLPQQVTSVVQRFHAEAAAQREGLARQIATLLARSSRLQKRISNSNRSQSGTGSTSGSVVGGNGNDAQVLQALGEEIALYQRCEAILLDVSRHEEAAIAQTLKFWRPRHSQALSQCTLAKLRAEAHCFVRDAVPSVNNVSS